MCPCLHRSTWHCVMCWGCSPKASITQLLSLCWGLSYRCLGRRASVGCSGELGWSWHSWCQVGVSDGCQMGVSCRCVRWACQVCGWSVGVRYLCGVCVNRKCAWICIHRWKGCVKIYGCVHMWVCVCTYTHPSCSTLLTQLCVSSQCAFLPSPQLFIGTPTPS